MLYNAIPSIKYQTWKQCDACLVAYLYWLKTLTVNTSQMNTSGLIAPRCVRFKCYNIKYCSFSIITTINNWMQINVANNRNSNNSLNKYWLILSRLNFLKRGRLDWVSWTCIQRAFHWQSYVIWHRQSPVCRATTTFTQKLIGAIKVIASKKCVSGATGSTQGWRVSSLDHVVPGFVDLCFERLGLVSPE